MRNGNTLAHAVLKGPSGKKYNIREGHQERMPDDREGHDSGGDGGRFPDRLASPQPLLTAERPGWDEEAA